mgnify:CR=1 FL=1
MAVTIETVRERIIAAIKDITPTATATAEVLRFHHVGDDHADVESSAPSSSMERAFEVIPAGFENGDIQHPGTREEVRVFRVKVKYPGMHDQSRLWSLAVMDQADIKVALEDGESWGADVIIQLVAEGAGPQLIPNYGILLVVDVVSTFLAPR